MAPSSPPAVYEIEHRRAKREVFGPILHVVRYPGRSAGRSDRSDQRHRLRPDPRRPHPHRRDGEDFVAAPVGNIYVNRNQIGAVVGAQPFGGEGLSGTGPKAGGPYYLHASPPSAWSRPTHGLWRQRQPVRRRRADDSLIRHCSRAVKGPSIASAAPGCREWTENGRAENSGEEREGRGRREAVDAKRDRRLPQGCAGAHAARLRAKAG